MRIVFILLAFHISAANFAQTLPVFNQKTKTDAASKQSANPKNSGAKQGSSSAIRPDSKEVVYRLISDVETYLYEGSGDRLRDSIKPGVPLKIVLEKGYLYNLKFVAKIDKHANYGDLFIIDETDKGKDYFIKLQPIIDSMANLRKIEIAKLKASLDSLEIVKSRAIENSFNYHFLDRFDNNANNWPYTEIGLPTKHDPSGADTYIMNGTLNFDSWEIGSDFSITRPFSGLDVNKDFQLSMDTKWMQDSANKGYGLTFCKSDSRNFYYFAITADGYFVIHQYKNGQWVVDDKWEASNYINKRGENKLTVSKKGNTFYFYINQFPDAVFSLPINNSLGNKFGPRVKARQKVLFDNFEIKGYNKVD